MNKKLVIFGSGEIAQLAHYYFTTDSSFELVAFTVDKSFISSDEFCLLPVIPFDELELHFPPTEYCLFIALSYSRLNQVRREKFDDAVARGYELVSYISSHATVLNDGHIGKNCFILEDNTIQPFVKIMDNVTLWSGNHIGHHSIIESHCFLASHIVVSGGVIIEEQCFIGVNATLRDHINVGARSIIGAGVLLLADTEPQSVYKGIRGVPSKAKSSAIKSI
jgi:sugar O-acyltransferase (sialic acid O-acetyltransferase NeuD family)